MAELAQLAELVEKLLAELLSADTHPYRTDLLVLQGTPFCNIACTYCYLPNRDEKDRMPHETAAAAVRWIFENRLADEKLTIAWHAGEPLVLPSRWYETAFARTDAAKPDTATLRHAIQTNATLIDDRWCEFFLRHPVNIGISIDGPADLHDARRRTRAGAGTHAAVMRGIAAMRRNKVPFHAIAVVTAETLDRPDHFLDFFEAEGIRDIGLNLEEIEGVNTTSSLASDEAGAAFRTFIERIVERAADGSPLRIREIGNLLGILKDPNFGAHECNDQNGPFRIVTVTHDGTLHTFSPELAGQQDGRFGSFALGNVHSSSLNEILASQKYRALSEEIEVGISKCRAECPYFRLCLGGAPANKLAECGRFDSTETMMCRLGVKEMGEIVLRRLERDLAVEA